MKIKIFLIKKNPKWDFFVCFFKNKKLLREKILFKNIHSFGSFIEFYCPWSEVFGKCNSKNIYKNNHQKENRNIIPKNMFYNSQADFTNKIYCVGKWQKWMNFYKGTICKFYRKSPTSRRKLQ